MTNKIFKGMVEEGGYELMALEPKYLDTLVQQYGLNLDHYHLYKLG